MPVKKHLYIGGGLHGWGAPSRFSASAVSNIMGLDTPAYQEPLGDLSDQALRNLGIYAKGTISKLNYRIALNKPFAFSKSDAYNAQKPIDRYAMFSPHDPALEIGGYLEWNFLEQELDKTPYKAGTHLGTKRIFNIGAGAKYRHNATWYTSNGDTLYSDMIIGCIDIFAEMPFKKGAQTAFNIYGAYTYSDFGPGYIKQMAPDNIATGSSLTPSNLYGSGNAAPLVGTGNSFYAQAGIISPKFSKSQLQLMPYVSFLAANYRAIKSTITLYESGVNLYIKNHGLKLTAGWQNHPFFFTETSHAVRRNMAVIQMQFSI